MNMHSGAAPEPASAHESRVIDGAILQGLNQIVARLAQAERSAFRELLAGLAAFLPPVWTGDEGERDTPCFVVDGVTLALQHDVDTHMVGFYADLGLPPGPGASSAVFRRLLEYNQTRTCEPFLFGLHPVSGRLVAHLRLALGALRGDAALCRDIMNEMAVVARKVRDW